MWISTSVIVVAFVAFGVFLSIHKNAPTVEHHETAAGPVASTSPPGAVTPTPPAAEPAKTAPEPSPRKALARPKGGNVSAGQSSASPAGGITQTMVNSPGASQAGRDIIITNPGVDYVDPDQTVRDELTAALVTLRAKYANQRINVMVAPEAGSSQRKSIGKFIGEHLKATDLGYFPKGSTFMGNFTDAPLTVVCGPADVPIAKDVLSALSSYLSVKPLIQPDDRFSNGNMELYIYGQPTFKQNGSVTIH